MVERPAIVGDDTSGSNSETVPARSNGSSMLEAQMEKVKDSLLVTERHAKQLEDQLQKLQSLMAANNLAQQPCESPKPVIQPFVGTAIPIDRNREAVAEISLAVSRCASPINGTAVAIAAALPPKVWGCISTLLLPESHASFAATARTIYAVVLRSATPWSDHVSFDVEPDDEGFSSGGLLPTSTVDVVSPTRTPARDSPRAHTPPNAVRTPPVPQECCSPSGARGHAANRRVSPPPVAAMVGESPVAIPGVNSACSSLAAPAAVTPVAISPGNEVEAGDPARHDILEAFAAMQRRALEQAAHQNGESGSRGNGACLSTMPSRLPPALERHFELAEGGDLGEGSVAIVRRIRDKRDGQTLALKVMEKHPLFIRNMAQQVHREVKLQSMMKHPNVLRLFDFLEDDSHIYMLLELAGSGGFLDLLQRQPGGRLLEPAGGWMYAQVVEGLSYLHDKNCIHRDLKPDNILLGEAYCPKICDFGWCADLSEGSSRRTTCGTLDYMAPEVLLNEGHGLPVDLWSLGILLYEILSGHTPFLCTRSKTGDEFLTRVVEVKYPFPPWFSNEACHLVHCLLQRQPSHRWPTPKVLSHPWLVEHYTTPKQAGRSPVIEAPSYHEQDGAATVGATTVSRELVTNSLADLGVPPKVVALGPGPAIASGAATAGISKSLSHSELLSTSTPTRGFHAQQPSSENALASGKSSGLRVPNTAPLQSATPQTLRGLAARRPTSPPIARATATSTSANNTTYSGPGALAATWGAGFSPATLGPNSVPTASLGASIATVAGTGNVPGSPNAVSGRPFHGLHTGTSVVFTDPAHGYANAGEAFVGLIGSQNIPLAIGANGSAPPRSPRQPAALGVAAPSASIAQRSAQMSPLGSSHTSTSASSTSGVPTTTSVGNYMASISPLSRAPLQSVPAIQALGSQSIVTATPQMPATSSTTPAHVVVRRNLEVMPPSTTSGPGGSIGAWPGLRDQTPAALRPSGAPTVRSHTATTSPTIAQSLCSGFMSSAPGVGFTSALLHGASSGTGTPLPPPGQASPRALFGRSSRDAPSPIAQIT